MSICEKEDRLKHLRLLTFAKNNIEKNVKERVLFKNHKERFERSLHLFSEITLHSLKTQKCEPYSTFISHNNLDLNSLGITTALHYGLPVLFFESHIMGFQVWCGELSNLKLCWSWLFLLAYEPRTPRLLFSYWLYQRNFCFSALSAELSVKPFVTVA